MRIGLMGSSFNKQVHKTLQGSQSEERHDSFVSNKVSSLQYRANFMPSFGYFYHEVSGKEGMTYKTHFYREDLPLWIACQEIKNTFPNGTDVLDFACSNGEEAISIYSILNKDENKYKVRAYDVDEFPLSFAKDNIYGTFSGEKDDWLIRRDELEDSKFLEYCPSLDILRECFYNCMEETDAPEKPIFYEDDQDYICSKLIGKAKGPESHSAYDIHHFEENYGFFNIKYFKMKEEHLKNITYEKGDIKELDKILPDKKVGAIFFRNAFYHIMQNLLRGNVADFGDINRQQIADDIIDKIYNKLEPGGIFVMGKASDEHQIFADKYTPKSNTIETPNYRGKIFFKKSPIHIALGRDGRFVPIKDDGEVDRITGQEKFAVWKKVK